MENEKCPKCGSFNFAIARDMVATRHCLICNHKWVQEKKNKKTIEAWANVYKYHETYHATKENADMSAQDDRIACVKLVGEYEIELED